MKVSKNSLKNWIIEMTLKKRSMSAKIEETGGITLDNVEEYAKTKVDTISVGSLTGSIKAIDMSLEIIP